MRRWLIGLLLCLGVLAVASPALAGDGDVDLTWGGTGVVRLGIGDNDWSVRSAAYGVAGVEVVGNVDSTGLGGPLDAMILMRFRGDGTRDTTCLGSGYAMFTTSDPVTVTDLVVLADGSTIVVGTIESTQPQGFVMKYAPNCRLDSTFAAGLGMVTYTDRLGVRFTSADIAGDGSIVIGGLTLYAPADGGSSRFTVVRITPAGDFEPSFGIVHPGVWVSDGTEPGQVRDLIIDSTGAITFAGTAFGISDTDAAIGRLTNTGTIDSTFANSGWFVARDGNDGDLRAIVRRPNGAVAAVGAVAGATSPVLQGTLYCLNANGALDSSCGPSGVVNQFAIPHGGVDFLFWSVVVDDSGRFVVSGAYDDPSVPGGRISPFVVRLRSDGSPDPTFGTNGVVDLPFAPGHAVHITRDQTGRILVGGHEFTQTGVVAPVVRLTASTTTTTTTTTTVSPTTTTPATVAPSSLPATGRRGGSMPILAVGFVLVGMAVTIARRTSNMSYRKGEP